jgi:hypothetical protein
MRQHRTAPTPHATPTRCTQERERAAAMCAVEEDERQRLKTAKWAEADRRAGIDRKLADMSAAEKRMIERREREKKEAAVRKCVLPGRGRRPSGAQGAQGAQGVRMCAHACVWMAVVALFAPLPPACTHQQRAPILAAPPPPPPPPRPPRLATGPSARRRSSGRASATRPT